MTSLSLRRVISGGVITLGLLLITGSIYTQSPPQRQHGQELLNKVYDQILDRYVADIDPDKLALAAIDGMLSELDPYSQHIDESNSHRIDAITTGEYGGVGIRLGRMNDSLVVVSPMDGTPAYFQGILAGDRIIQIDSVRTRGMSLNVAADLVRGERGSILELQVLRWGEPDPLIFELERELIKVPDVSYSGLVDNRLGYIKLSNFSRYAAEDLEKAVRKLDRSGMQGLILDLRGNPGGLLSAALQSADLFIDKGELLLETRGRLSTSNRAYHARRRPVVDKEMPVAVLIDGGSASASEILAGVLQDYDRAVLIGEPSFGKGLVQTITSLEQDARLKLTTARYYLPTGRLIQKRQIAEHVIYDDLLEDGAGTFYSEAQRRFTAGEGVHPDVIIEPMPSSVLERALWRQRSFFRYALEFTEESAPIILPVKLPESVVDSFYTWLSSTGNMPRIALDKQIVHLESALDSSLSQSSDWTELRESLDKLVSKQMHSDFQSYRTQILSGLEKEVANVVGGNGARIEAGLHYDPVVARASDILRSRSELESILAGALGEHDLN